MPWFNKKGEETTLPELPDLPEIPGSNDKAIFGEKSLEPEISHIETTPLPPLPGSQGQDQIKQAINKPENELQKSKFAPLPPPREYEPKSPEIKPAPVKMKIEEPPASRGYQVERSSRPSSKKTEPIYVKLDKFETTVQAFDEVRDKITEIERLLAKTRDIKAQEEKELEEWEKEIQIIKSRLESIDKAIFKDLD
ncbi:Uncharacterised protein [uncultured archaeon]|nr:Uncharacterised protein [uncultured archaeon]